jgi:hypothetical protein
MSIFSPSPYGISKHLGNYASVIFRHEKPFNIPLANCNEMNNEVLEVHANSASLVFRSMQLTSVDKVRATECHCHRRDTALRDTHTL